MSCSSNPKKPLMTLNNETIAVNKKPPPSSSSSSPPHQESSSSHTDPKNCRGRKPAVKTPAAKKPPQRGLGVAQLERLRMQERWKKMTEMPSSTNTNNTSNNINGQVPLLQQPLESVPVQYGAGGYGGRLALVGGGGGGASASGSFLLSAGNGSGAVMNHGSNHVPHDYQMINNNIQTNAQFLTPNAQFFDNFSFRKKRFNDEINGGDYNINNNNNNNNNPNEIIQMGNNGNNLNHNSINIPNNIYNDPNSLGEHLTLGYGTSSKVPRNSSSDPHSQDIEVMAVHKRKPNSCENVVEYEFFPGLKIQNLANNNDNYHYIHNHDYDYNGNEASYNYANNVPANGGGSSINNNNNNHLDLSLKL